MRVKIIKFITYLALITLLVFSTALDSDSNIPVIVMYVCIAWLTLIVIANIPKGGEYHRPGENIRDENQGVLR